MLRLVSGGTMWGEDNKVMVSGSNSPNDQFLSLSCLKRALSFPSDFLIDISY